MSQPSSVENTVAISDTLSAQSLNATLEVHGQSDVHHHTLVVVDAINAWVLPGWKVQLDVLKAPAFRVEVGSRIRPRILGNILGVVLGQPINTKLI